MRKQIKRKNTDMIVQSRGQSNILFIHTTLPNNSFSYVIFGINIAFEITRASLSLQLHEARFFSSIAEAANSR
jgi:hypothetical protein